MKTVTVLSGLVVSLMLAGLAFAADVSGKWTADFEAQNGQRVQNVFTFVVNGETLTGTVHSSMSGSEAKIEEGSVKGDDVAFAITRNFGGNDVRLRYTGKVVNDEINFIVVAGEGGQGFELRITAKRQKP